MTRTPKGLHPSYIALNPPVEQMDKRTLTQDDLLEVGLQDIFNAVNLQDHLNSSISLIICCAGVVAGPKFLSEKIPLDIYITPCKLQATPECIGGDVAVWAQVFAQEFPIPHLQCFLQSCAIEKVTPLRCFPTGARIQCSVQPSEVFGSNLQACANDLEAANIPSAAIREGVMLTKSISTQPAAFVEVPHQLCQCRLADVFCPSRNPGEKLGQDGFDASMIAPAAVKVVLKGEVTQRASASACALRPLPKGQRESPMEVRGVLEDLVSVEFGGTPGRLMRGWSKATMEVQSRN
ncbi:uncharacterized protein EDB91DRAFT_1086152 [Suillus paluster]|uniref:uncharacterized protein n=1 Tax=Suillus paluster TaxID=48578 RepID=UPI001B870328|nr:uncharacterized protein EDB91DRAFT_1086152 [Suillus paluster]KAG1728276.1 hypothetical protein EDB91DRAFT_1086152 [Suillus paluster]